MTPPSLSIVADDYGYADHYDAGIVAAATAGAIDGASIMVMRGPDPGPLAATSVGLGLHLEPGSPPTSQVRAFERLAGRPPDYIDGHHHCHAAAAVAPEVAMLGARLGVPVRAIDDRHRRLLRERGVITADRLVGRLAEAEAALPEEIGSWLGGAEPGAGWTEWFVHPGYPDPATGSSYDAGRGEDLALVLELGDRAAWARRGIRRVPLAASPRPS